MDFLTENCREMVASRRIKYVLCSMIAACCVVSLLFVTKPTTKSAPKLVWNDIERHYFVPIDSPPSASATDSSHVDWQDLKSTSSLKKDDATNWKLAKSVRVERCPTPDVFSFLRSSENLQILGLNVDQPGNRCVFTGVEQLPALRTLQIEVSSDTCSLENCRALAQCKRLECVVFGSGFRVTKSDMQELSASRTLECVSIASTDSFVPGAIAALKDLRTLKSIKAYFVSASFIRELSEIPSLEHIFLGCPRSGTIEDFAELKKLPNLKYVSICLNNADDREAVKATLPGIQLVLYDDPN